MHGHRHGRLRDDQRSPRSRPPTRAASTSSSPTTTASRPSCRPRSRSSTRIAPTRPTRTGGWPGAASPSRSPSCCSLTSRAVRRPRSTWPTSRRSAPSPTSRPIVGENRAIARLGLERLRTRAPARDRGPPRAGARRPGGRRPRDRRVRHRAAAQRGRAGGGGARGRAAPARRRPGRGRPPTPTRSRPPTSTRRDLMKSAVAEARAARRRDGPASRGHRRPRSVARRDRRPRGRPAGRGPRPPGRRRRRARRRRSGPRAGATARSTSRRALERCARPVHPLRRPRRRRRLRARRPTAGTRSASGSSALAAGTAPPDPRSRSRSTWPSRRSTSTTPCYRELAGLAPCGPGNPDPLVAVLGLTVTRVRAATGGHSQLTLRRERDVLDGIAFGRPDLAEVVREGDRLDVVARLTSRRFGGFESLQLDIRDVATSGSHPARRRRSWPSATRLRSVAGARHDRAVRAAPARLRDRFGIRPHRIAGSRPALSVVGLLLVALVTLSLLNGNVPFVGGSTGTATATGRRRQRERERRPGRDPRTVERRRRARRRQRSRARSSTPRPATSGSRPARTPTS